MTLRLKHMIAFLLPLLCWTFGALQGQEPRHRLPSACYSPPVRLERVVSPPADYQELHQMWLDRLSPLVRPNMTARESDESWRAIHHFWLTDSLHVEWMLADMVTDNFQVPDGLALRAANAYETLSGRAGPMLAQLETNGGEYRRALALSAIRSPLTRNQMAQVVQYACDASLYLLALRADTLMARMWSERGLNAPVWSEGVVREARRLVGDRMLIVDTLWSLVGSGRRE